MAYRGVPLSDQNVNHFIQENSLTHWGRVTHICVGNLTIISPDNGLSPGRRQAIIRTSAGILLIEPSRTNFSEISIAIHTFSFKEMHLKMSSVKWRPFCLGLNVLKISFAKWHPLHLVRNVINLRIMYIIISGWKLIWRGVQSKGLFYSLELTLIPAWISNNIHYKVRDEITYPFPKFNSATVDFGMDKWLNPALNWACTVKPLIDAPY